MRPWLAIWVVEQLVGGVVVGEAFGLGVPIEPGPGRQRDIGQQGVAGRAMALLDVATGTLAGLDAVQEIAGVARVELAVAIPIAQDDRLDARLGCPGMLRRVRG